MPAPDAAKDPDPTEPACPRRAWYRRPGVMAIIVVLVTGGTLGGLLWWRHARQYEETDDAYVDAVAEQVSTRVAGQVARVLVNDNADVAAGAIVVELDPAEYAARREQALAAEAQARAQVAEARAQKEIRVANLDQARAGLAGAEAAAANARSDLARLRQINAANSAALTPQALEHAAAADKTATAQLDVTRQAVASAQAQLSAADTTIATAEAGVKNAAAARQQAELALGYTQVRTATAGQVAHKTVAAGNTVSPGEALMAIVPPGVYVTANFKETQLRRMRRGQPVEIRVDAYPDLRLSGRVDSIQPATGMQFSEIPAQNATGNWVKVVQRVPVKIVLDPRPNASERRLGVGWSVVAKVTVQP